MEQLIGRIQARLRDGAYSNEAAVSVGIVMPIIQALGWDTSDPDLFAPEFNSGRGRVDFALCLPPRRPSVFIEVKGVGKGIEGDRQLFEYAFHEGVPICVLTDGRDWSFYLPSGQGSYDERRVYRLLIDDRAPSESLTVFERYLRFDRVRSGKALEDAAQDYRDAAARREAARIIPRAWAELVGEPETLLVDLLADKTESLCGYRPTFEEVFAFLKRGQANEEDFGRQAHRETTAKPPATHGRSSIRPANSRNADAISYELFGQARTAPSANAVLIDILATLATRYPTQLNELAIAVKGRARNHIARSAAEIYPNRPDLARPVEFYPGWLIGLNIANREKMNIIREACLVFDIVFGRDLKVEMLNAD